MVDQAQAADSAVAAMEAHLRTGKEPDAGGIGEVRAWQSATNGHGPWWNGGASHMNAAYPKSWFNRMGLVSLLETRQRLTPAS